MENSLEVTIRANIQQLKKDLQAAKKELENLGDATGTVEKDSKKISDSFEGIKKSSSIFKAIDQATGGIAGNAADIVNGFKGATLGANAFKAALISTGIGAILVGVTSIAVYWDDIVAAVDGVNRELAKQREIQQEIVDNAQYQVDLINSQLDSLKLQGKSDKEINALKRERLTILLEEKKAILDIAKTQLERTISSEKQSRAVLEKFTKYAVASQVKIAEAFDSLFGTNFAKDIKEIYESSLDFFAGTDSKDAQKEIKDLELELSKLQNTIDKTKLDDIKIDKKAVENSKKAAEDLAKLFEQINKDLEILDEEKAQENADAVRKIYEDSGARIVAALKLDSNEFDFGIDDSFQAIKSFEDKLQDIRKLLNDPNFNFDSVVSLPEMDELISNLQRGAKEAVLAKEITNSAISELSGSLMRSIESDNEVINFFVSSIIGVGEKLLQELTANAIAGIAIKQAQAATTIAIDQTTATSGAIASATSTAAASGPAAAFLLPALIGAAIGFVAASFAGIKFASGGVVPGGSFNGDRIPALLNSAEMVLNTRQQSELFKIANGNVRKSGSSDAQINVVGVISGSDILLSSDRAKRNNKRY